jgi:hypothetical protein
MLERFTELFLGRRKTPKLEPRPETPVTVAQRLEQERSAREEAAKRAAAAWEERQRQEHADWIAAAQADMALRAERARREGTDGIGFVHAGEIPTVDVGDGEVVWLDWLGTRRGHRRLR